MRSEPKVGQLVYLNSGSPALTVVEVHTHSLVTVSWITPEGRPYSGTYHHQCLTELQVASSEEETNDTAE